MSETRPPSFEGPLPLHPPKTAKLDIPGVSDSPSGVHKALSTVTGDVLKMKRTSRIKMYSALGGTVLTLLGGGKLAVAKGETIETKQARTEERQTNDHAEIQSLKVRVDAGEKARQHTDLKVERVEALLELELDMHGVPKSKRPAPVPESKDEP